MYPIAVLCGGLGTRMFPTTETIPKALIPVLGQPFIGHLLRLLAANGFTDAVLCVGYLGEMIERYVGNGSRFGLDVRYSYDGPALIGTAGAIRRAVEKLGGRFFTIYGDAYLPCDYGAIQQTFDNATADGLMTIYHNRATGVPSNVMVTDGVIKAYEKGTADPRFEYIDYGVQVFRSSAFDGVRQEKRTDLAIVIERLIAAGSLAAFEVLQRFHEIGSPEGLAEITAYLKERESAG